MVVEPSGEATVAIVVPCFNEAERLRPAAFLAYAAAHPRTRFHFVNDGSRDATAGVLETLRSAAPDRITVSTLAARSGKAEAVRAGMVHLLSQSPRYAGYWDADLATPLSELPALEAILEHDEHLQMVFGSRVRLLGRVIERSPVRHYSGRVFATAVSLALKLPVYDTQCGAKLFRVNSLMRQVFATPFRAGWIFDVEVIARYGAFREEPDDLATRIYEYPLSEWRDIRGSKRQLWDYAKAAIDLAVIYSAYSRRARSEAP